MGADPMSAGRSLALAGALALCGGCGGPAPASALAARVEQGAADRRPTLSVSGLRCEHEEEPLALDTPAPRFSWRLEALDPERRGLAQSAYRVLVAASAAELEAERGELWDSGRTESRETLDVAYAGRALRSFELVHWKVRVWDQDGVPSAWSAPARFGMGALAPSDWRARWIGFDAPLRGARPVPDLGSAPWIRAPLGERELHLRRRFELAGPPSPQAVLVVAAVDELELWLNGKSLLRAGASPGVRRNAELQKVAQHLVPGENVLAARVRTRGDAPAALCLRLLLDPAVRDSAEIVSDAAWRVAASAPSGWEGSAFDDSGWQAAGVLGEEEEAALAPVDPPAVFLPPPRLLRGEFRARSRPARATFFASALGTYSLELNGARVGEDWLAPGWTDYAKRVPYRGYDVTALVREGENALGVVLADGWYAGLLGKRGQRNHYGESPRFLGQLVLEHADGTRELVASDSSWRAAVGPWREADLYMGERYDARAELPGWSAPGFDARAWAAVDATPSAPAPLASHPGPRIRAFAELEPVEIHERGPGRAILDFGQNLAGVARLALEAPAGTAVVLRFAEALEADGTLMRRNLSWARAVDQYVCKGGGRETWQPRFTYHGFRFVEVSGLPSPPTRETVRAVALSSATRLVGEFRCSDPLLERLVENARWTLRANSMDVPTDCPQRGERLGWTGDAQLFAPSALWLADLRTLYDKWGRDLLDAQRADGRFPNTAPSFPGMPSGGAAWEEAGVLVPALVHERYGDRRLAERHLPSMLRFLDTFERDGELLPLEGRESFGDWHALERTPSEVIALAYLARSTRAAAECARALGRTAEAAALAARLARVKQAFAARCVAADGTVLGDTQTGYALALREDLVPAELRARAAARLVAGLEDRGSLATGFVGTAELLPALSAIGRSDLAYGLLRSRAFPSWGAMVERGATTVWEQWDAWTPEHGFARDGRASLNHTPLAAFVAWLFESVAGMRPLEPGFRSVALAPVPGGGLTWAEASHDSARGRIALRWELVGSELRLELCLPPNVPATLSLPCAPSAVVREGGRALAESEGVRELGRTGALLLLALSPGSYSLACREPVLAR